LLDPLRFRSSADAWLVSQGKMYVGFPYPTSPRPPDPSQGLVKPLRDATATDVSTAQVDLSSGRTWTFATQNPPIFTANTLITAELIPSGYGRILSTDTSTLYVAHLIDPAKTQPVFMTNLPLVDVRERQVFLPLTSDW
jgi:hypothetical protein